MEHGALQLIEPLIVNSAFATELYLKFLNIKIYETSGVRGHNLEKLFEPLPKDVKQSIQHDWETWEYLVQRRKQMAKNKIPIIGFRKTLSDSAKEFEQWRYSYEFKKLRGGNASSIGECVRRYIKKTYGTEFRDEFLALPAGIPSASQRLIPFSAIRPKWDNG